MQQIRNPVHVQWCQLLLLLRTMNDQLLDNPHIENQEYFSDLVRQIRMYKYRITRTFHLGLQMDVRIPD